MANYKPLVFDTSRGASRQVDAGDTLHLPGGLQLDGGVGFYGTAPQARPAVAGSWSASIDALIQGLAGLGLIQDSRLPNWNFGISNVNQLGTVGPYEPGRLIIGSITGWTQLDQPALVPGVIQVPTAHAGPVEISPISGLPMQQLAYSPILSYGATQPPTPAQTGSLWYDIGTSELKVYTGTAWVSVQPAAISQINGVLTGAARGQLLMADGLGGIAALALSAAAGGRSLVFDDAAAPHAVELIAVAATPPWPNGKSCFAAPGLRPTGVHQAIWANTAANAETLGFWDEAAQQWKSVYVNNPILNQLAELRSATVDGDLFTIKSNTVVRLPAGRTGDSLVVDSSGLKWHDRFSKGPVAPAGALDGDLWLDDVTDAVRVRENGQWHDINRVSRYVDVNGAGSPLRPGQPLVHGAPNWRLAGPLTPAGAFVAICLDAALPGTAAAAAIGGVVSLTAAQWSAVIDTAEPQPAGSGLSPGRDYYVSSTDAGYLTTKPAGESGVPVGTALSATHLLLRPGVMRDAAGSARVSVGPKPPVGRPGELWWSNVTGQLYVFFDDGSSRQWVSVSTDGSPDPSTGTGSGSGGSGSGSGSGGSSGGGTATRGVRDLEAIDWVSDPLAAAIRVKYDDGTEGALRIRGAGGAVVTMSDSRTIVIDAGATSPASSRPSWPVGATEGQVLVWRSGVPVWETFNGTGLPSVIDAGNFTTGVGTPRGGMVPINGGHFTP